MPAPLIASNAQSDQTVTRNGGKVVNVKRKSSKPIINWFQRKLAGTVRTRRISNVANGGETASAQRATSLKDLRRSGSAPSPSDVDENGFRISQEMRRGISNEISLNDDERGATGYYHGDDLSTRKSVSIWSRSNPLEADEDASIRPLPPTSPPSPSPSRSSSSYISDPRTFKSMSTSTKPTTVLSMDLTTGTNGMAHIAQAPPTPTTTGHPGPFANTMTAHTARLPPHIRTSSSGPGTSITFSALPPSPQSSRPSSLNPARSGSTGASGVGGSPIGVAGGVTGSISIQAPQHTSHHPRNNPRPSSPPLDNASMLTLASSAFGMPGARTGGYTGTYGGYGGDSASHLGGGDSLSHFVSEDALSAEDRDASLRALRPRSSRRGSWDSEASGWSAAVSGIGSVGFVGQRSVRTAPSYRTGGPTMDDHDENASFVDGDEGTSLRADAESLAQNEDGEPEKEHRRSGSVGSHDEEHCDDDDVEMSTPAMQTQPLHSIAPDTTPKREKIAILGEPDDIPALPSPPHTP